MKMAHSRADIILGTDVIPERQKHQAIDVTTSMLDYKYVEDCKDVVTLKEILRVLVSGKEGRYPQLEETVVERILSILPEKSRKKIFSMTSTVSSQEVEMEKKALNDWLHDLQMKISSSHKDDEVVPSLCDEDNESSASRDDIFTTVTNEDMKQEERMIKNHHPVRNIARRVSKSATVSTKKPKTSSRVVVDKEKGQRISKESYSNRDYFRAWDKFDFEEAEKRVDDDEKENDDETPSKNQGNSAKIDKWKVNVQNQSICNMKELQDLQVELQVSKLSSTEREFMASREKDKGNECFKNKEYEESFRCYSKSLAFYDKNAIVYANRAMTCIRLSNLCQAVSDCTQALAIDPNYTKALARRGMVHHKCGRYLEAKIDFHECINQDSENKEYQQLLKKATEKYDEVYGIEKHEKSKKKIVIIQEDNSDSDSEEDDEVEEVYTPGAMKS